MADMTPAYVFDAIEARELEQMNLDALKVTIKLLSENNADLRRQVLRWEGRVMELENRMRAIRLMFENTKEPAQSGD